MPNTPTSAGNTSAQAADADFLFQQAALHHRQGALDQAKALYGQALARHPQHFDATLSLGILSFQSGDAAQALVLFDKALAWRSNHAIAHYFRADALHQLQQPEAALLAYDQALKLLPTFAEAAYRQAGVLHELNRLGEALASYDRATAIKPGFADAHFGKGSVLHDLQRFDEALSSYDQALAIKPDYTEALDNRGLALHSIRRLKEALESYNRALQIKPDSIATWINRGNVLKDLQLNTQALDCYDRALAVQPDSLDALNNRGHVLCALDRYEEALRTYRRILEIDPDRDYVAGAALGVQLKLCDWQGLETAVEQIKADVARNRRVINPFTALGVSDDPAMHLQASRIYLEALHPRRHEGRSFPPKQTGEKIRIGYYSADFHNHATSYLMAELFERHDRSEFELWGFSFGPNSEDEMRKRVASAFDHFIDVTAMSDDEVARYSRQVGIDIAVDLKGFTGGARTSMFAEGCAPIQVNYLGYPGTMGAPYIDYLIADKTLIPEALQAQYSEKIVYLPHSYQVNDSRRKISERAFTRQEVGLPQESFVFCCFNNNYKILPATFNAWMRILQAVDHSVIWLFQDNPGAAENLRQAAAARGVDARRLVFANRMPLDEHLARHRLADLFLDTLPINAHTTASDALWAGLPVLTLAGQSFAGRVAASLLNALGLPDMVTNTPQEYEAMAVALARQPDVLSAIRSRLKHNKAEAPLFNARLFARHLEAAYRTMVDRQRSGLAPEHIHVQEQH